MGISPAEALRLIRIWERVVFDGIVRDKRVGCEPFYTWAYYWYGGRWEQGHFYYHPFRGI